MSTELIAAAAGGGAVIGTIATTGVAIYNARKKTPAEVENLQADASAINVQSALAIAKAESERADRAEALVRERDKHIEALLSRVEALQSRADALQTALDAVREELTALRSVASP